MNKYLKVPLSNIDLSTAVKQWDPAGANIYPLKDLQKNTPMEEVWKNKGHVVFFHEYPDSSVGHWFVATRNPHKEIFLFDSFGKKPDYYNKNILPFLKNNGIKQIIINNKPMQHDESAICGRYSLIGILTNKLNVPMNDFYKFFEAGKKKYGSYDKFVLSLTT